jgi:hypothetical protein
MMPRYEAVFIVTYSAKDYDAALDVASACESAMKPIGVFVQLKKDQVERIDVPVREHE